MKIKHFSFILFSFVLLFFAVSANAQDAATIEATSIVKVGDVAPDFTTEMLDGSSFKLSQAKGKVILLNFWATWCSYCMMEFNEVPEKLLKRFAGKADFVFIPVSREETRETVQKKMAQLKENGISFPVGLDPNKKIYDLYAKSYIPRNYVIGKDGKVVYATVGFTPEEFEKMVDKLAELLN
jgi:peroxiredoxin